MATIEDFINDQVELAGWIDRYWTNTLKTGKDNLTPAILEHRQIKLDEYWDDFITRHRKMRRHKDAANSAYLLKDEFAATELKYFEISGLIANAIKERSAPSIPETSAAESTPSAPKRVHLPKIDLPKFDGDLLNWENFKGLFQALIHEDKEIPNVLKLQYLRSSLSGETADLLSNIAITDAGYDGAWTDLLNTYENEHLLLFKYMRNIVTCPPVIKQTASELKRLLTTVRQSQRAFEALKRPVSHWSDWFLFLTVEKLNTTSRIDWQTSLDDGKKISTFERLIVFLENRIQALEATFSKDPRSQPPSPFQPGKESGNSSKRKSGSSACLVATSGNKTKPAVKCPLCQQGHTLGYCFKFKKLSFSQRKKKAKKLGACLNCLHTDHEMSKCDSKFRCTACNGMHHTLLHSAVTGGEGSSHHSANETGAKSSHDSKPTAVATSEVASYSVTTRRVVLLATARVQLQGPNGNLITVRALLDTASESSFITEWAAQTLQLPRRGISVPIPGVQGATTGSANSEVKLHLRSMRSNRFCLPLQALVLRTLTTLLPSSLIEEQSWPHLAGLCLADPDFAKPSRVDVILGADVCGMLFENDSRRGPLGSPSALLTVFGWVLIGSTQLESTKDPVVSLHCQTHSCSLHNLQRFWELEEITIDKPLSPEDERCQQLFQATYTRDNEGFVVRLPMTDDESVVLGQSRQAAMKLLLSTERRLATDSSLKSRYVSFMQEYLELGHMEPVPDVARFDSNACYLPHHAVTKQHDSTGKLRVVFNASFKTATGFSLNDRLLSGPKLQSELWLVLTRWRLPRIVFTTDIVKMFRQIRVHPDDANYQRILWRKEQDEPVKDYKLTTVTYGTACAPYLALRVLLQLADDERLRFPLGAEAIESHSYVDDILAGADDIPQAIEMKRQVQGVFAAGGFPLSKWASNCPELCPQVDTNARHFQDTEGVSTLGLSWSPIDDTFSLKVAALPTFTTPLTKRAVLSEVARLFDPLGWVAPVIVTAKIMIQDLWLAGLDWDQTLPAELSDRWLQFRANLPDLEQLRIPRWVSFSTLSIASVQLLGFSDASQRAFAAAVYLRVTDSVGRVHSSLLVAKTKVAPVKAQSVPRLELCAAVLLVRLLKTVSRGLNFTQVPLYAWTDSQVVLAWIRGHASQWPTFVAHRVSEIQSTLPASQWRYLRTDQNPADLGTRGIKPHELIKAELWLKGPGWLQELESSWPSGLLEAPRDAQGDGQTTTTLHAALQPQVDELLLRYSNLSKLIRLLAIWCRYFYNIRHQDTKRTGFLLAGERFQGLKYAVKLSQRTAFIPEIAALSKGTPIQGSSPLLPLTPFLDEDGLLRLGGRLQNAVLSFDEKHPYVIAKTCPLATLLVRDAHAATLHGGPELTRSHLSRRFWILKGRSLIRSIIRECVRCARFSGRTSQQIMGQLPADRTKPTRPFLTSGVDYAGPIMLRPSRARGNISTKGYICLFVCLSTKAIHLEAVSDLCSTSFVSAFHRFTARRGRCARLLSDNATYFRGADRELRTLLRAASDFYVGVARELAGEGTSWHFIPPYSPNFGGLWEAGVKSTKHHLRRALGERTPTYEELATFLCQVEACLNSRPLTPISNDPNDLTALTPGHFLIGDPLTSTPEPGLDDVNSNLITRWRQVSKMRDHFWRRWSREYLTHLQQLPTWRRERENLQVGTLVLIKDDLLPPAKWSMGRITEVHPGPDGFVRVVSLWTNKGTTTRAISKICPLPVKATQDA